MNLVLPHLNPNIGKGRGNADLNGAKNIQSLGVAFVRHSVAVVSPVEGSGEPPR